jgi:hypothetical protein
MFIVWHMHAWHPKHASLSRGVIRAGGGNTSSELRNYVDIRQIMNWINGDRILVLT